jgi:hypothetical protein
MIYFLLKTMYMYMEQNMYTHFYAVVYIEEPGLHAHIHSYKPTQQLPHSPASISYCT